MAESAALSVDEVLPEQHLRQWVLSFPYPLRFLFVSRPDVNAQPQLESCRRRLWRTVDAVEYAVLEWVDWFNHRWLLEPIGNIPPAGLEAAYYRQQEESAMVV